MGNVQGGCAMVSTGDVLISICVYLMARLVTEPCHSPSIHTWGQKRKPAAQSVTDARRTQATAAAARAGAAMARAPRAGTTHAAAAAAAQLMAAAAAQGAADGGSDGRWQRQQ